MFAQALPVKKDLAIIGNGAEPDEYPLALSRFPAKLFFIAGYELITALIKIIEWDFLVGMGNRDSRHSLQAAVPCIAFAEFLFIVPLVKGYNFLHASSLPLRA